MGLRPDRFLDHLTVITTISISISDLYLIVWQWWSANVISCQWSVITFPAHDPSICGGNQSAWELFTIKTTLFAKQRIFISIRPLKGKYKICYLVKIIRKETVSDNLHCTKIQFNIMGCHVQASANLLRCQFQLTIRLVFAKRLPGWHYMHFYSLCSSAISANENGHYYQLLEDKKSPFVCIWYLRSWSSLKRRLRARTIEYP